MDVFRAHGCGDGPAEDPLAGVVTRVRAALEDGPSTLDDDALLDLLSSAEELGRLVDAARSLLAAEAGERSRPMLGTDRLSARRGCRSASELVERAALVGPRTARDRLRRGGRLAGGTALSGEVLPGPLPLLAEAFAAGLVGLDVVDLVASALVPAIEHGAAPHDVSAAERALVGAATGGATGEDPGTDGLPLTVPQVEVMSRAWSLVLDADGPAPAEGDDGNLLRHRYLSLGRMRHGTVRLSGELAPEAAAQLQRLLDAVQNPRVAGGGDAPGLLSAGEGEGEGADGAGAQATGPGGGTQLFGDPDTGAGIGTGAGTGSGTGPGTGTGAGTGSGTGPGIDAATGQGSGTGTGAAEECAPDTGQAEDGPRDWRTSSQKRHDAFASILSTAASVPGMPMLGGAPPTLVVLAHDTQVAARDGVAFIDGVGTEESTVPASVARQVACSGAVQRVHLDHRGRITGIEAPSRVFSAHQRRAIAARDGGCVIPGCTVPSTWCEVHHVHEWARGGATTTDNGVLLCWFHHRTLDTSGWEIRMVDGTPQVRGPSWVDPRRRWCDAPTSLLLHHRRARRHGWEVWDGSARTPGATGEPDVRDEPDPPGADELQEESGLPEDWWERRAAGIVHLDPREQDDADAWPEPGPWPENGPWPEPGPWPENCPWPEPGPWPDADDTAAPPPWADPPEPHCRTG